jgi:membrane protein
MIKRIIDFIKTDIWRIRSKDLPQSKSFLIKQLRIILLAFRGFDEDKCQLRASALTFYSLLSIVPVAAMAFGVAKGFGFEKMLERQLMEGFTEHQEVIAQVVTFAKQLLENTKGGVVAGIGVAILFWTVIKVLGNVEKSFNDIWGIKQGRPIGRKFSDYLSMMLVCPILIIVSSGITVFITTQVKMLTENIAILGAFAPAISFMLKLLPYGIIWILFTFVYIFMPNTKVDFRSGLLAGIAAGTLYVIVQKIYIGFQVGVANYNAIYGSFAALPLFLMWLQISWLIVLLGAEISFARQNVDTYEFEPDCLRVNHKYKNLMALRITQFLAKNFSMGVPPSSANEISHALDMPIRLVREILFDLKEADVISRTYGSEYKEDTYQPALDLEKLTIQRVIESLENRGSADIPVADTEELRSLRDSLESFEDCVRKSPRNVILSKV